MKQNIYSGAMEASRALIRHIIEKVSADPEKLFDIAFSGGDTPLRMFDLWAYEYADVTPWEQIRFWWVDERCVKPVCVQSNYGQMYRTLLNKVPVPPKHIFRIRGENDPEKEAARYSKEVKKHVALVNGLPAFDLVLLGVGADGHTSSIFPGQEHLLVSSDLYAPSINPFTGQKRVAMTALPIINARQVIFLITGEGKQEVVHQLVSSGDLSPSAYIAHRAHQVELFLDASAAAKLHY